MAIFDAGNTQPGSRFFVLRIPHLLSARHTERKYDTLRNSGYSFCKSRTACLLYRVITPSTDTMGGEGTTWFISSDQMGVYKVFFAPPGNMKKTYILDGLIERVFESANQGIWQEKLQQA